MKKSVSKYLKDKKISRRGARWLIKLTAPYKWRITGLVAVRCVLSVVGILMAIVNKRIVDDASASLEMTASIMLAIGGSVISLGGNMLLSVFSVRVTERYSFHLRKGIYEHILRALWRNRTEYHSEGLLSRLTSDVNAIADGVIASAVTLVSTVIQLGMAFFVLWHYDWTLAVFALVTGPVAGIISLLVGRKLRRVQENLQQSEADYRVYLQEQISNADVVKAFCWEDNSLQGLEKLQKKRMYWVIRQNRLRVALSVGISIVFSGSYLFAFINGALKIAAGTITYGTMTAFLSLVTQVQAPIHTMSSLFPRIVGVLASAGRVLEIADMPEEEYQKPETTTPLRGKLSLFCEELCFSYGKEPILQNFSMTLRGGEIGAIMGPSGVGKTTLIRLLLGFLTPDSGRLVCRDEDGREEESGVALRRYISYVPQGNTLFSGTIADNLRCGKPDATEEEMRGALENAGAWSFVSSLPDNIHTVLGENAHGLSQGQAQRIAIARALIRPAPILIFDEATSALDEDTERGILRRLRERDSSQTCLVITHRNTVLDYCDCVIRLAGGKETEKNSV